MRLSASERGRGRRVGSPVAATPDTWPTAPARARRGSALRRRGAPRARPAWGFRFPPFVCPRSAPWPFPCRAPPPESPTRTGTARPTAKAVQGHRIPHAFLFPTFRPGRGARIVGRVERAWTDGCVRAAAAARGRGAVASLHVGAWQGHSGCCQAGLLECWWVLSVPRARVGTRPGFSRRPGEADLTAPPPGKRSGYADAAAM